MIWSAFSDFFENFTERFYRTAFGVFLKKIVKKSIIFCENLIIPAETIKESKEKWNNLAKGNYRFIMWTFKGENITDKELYQSGQNDYARLIEKDAILKNWLGDFSQKSVLEIGCGIGRMTQFLADNFQSVYATDISENLIDKCKKRLSHKINVNVFATDGVSLPFAESIFDFVFSYAVFQHMPSVDVVRKNLLEISRVMKNDGIAKIQLRGKPSRKSYWSYGIYFDTQKKVDNLLKDLPLQAFKFSGFGTREFWIFFRKPDSGGNLRR